jgi:serine/threonine protein kinase
MKGYTQKIVLGNKGFGKTYLAAEKGIEGDYSMKVIDISKLMPNEFDRNYFFPQMSRKWNHPNLVQLIESFVVEEAQQCVFVSKYCEGKVIVH